MILTRRRLRARISALLVALALVAIAVPIALAAPGTVIYDSQPNPLPGNLPSRAFQAKQTSEFGDQIVFAAGPRELGTASVVFSSFACEAGAWNTGDCHPHPERPSITPSPSTSMRSTPRTRPCPARSSRRSPRSWRSRSVLRPSGLRHCAQCLPGGWQGPDGVCFNGFAFTVEFDLGGVTGPRRDHLQRRIQHKWLRQTRRSADDWSLRLAERGCSPEVPPVMGTDADTNVLFTNTPSPPRRSRGFPGRSPGCDPGLRLPFGSPPSRHRTQLFHPQQPGEDLVGLVDTATGIWSLRGAAGGVTTFYYGDPGDVPSRGLGL